MRQSILYLTVFLLSFSLIGQVGINTTNPSPASVLDINSSSDGASFGGLMPPKVSHAQRDQIPVTAADDGLMVFVVDGNERKLQIFDGINFYWQTIFEFDLQLLGVVAAWEVSGLTSFGPSPFDPNHVHPVVSVGGLTRGSGVGTSTQGGGASNAWGGSNFDSPDKNTAIANEEYVYFTITPTSGNTVSLSSIEAYTTRRSSGGPTTGVWQYSINGVDFYDIGSDINWGTSSSSGEEQPAIDLSGINDLQNLTSATTVTFRIVSWGGSSATGTWYIYNRSGYDLIVKRK